MNKKTILIILAAFFVVACILPLVSIILVSVINNMPSGGFQDVAQTLFFLLICLGPVALAFGGLAWKIYHNNKSSKAAVRLSESLGLAQISRSNNPKKAWYGGEWDGRRFAVKPIAIRSYFYDGGGRRRPDVDYYLRIVLEVKVDGTKDVVVYRRPQERGGAATFEEAFHTKNASRLTGSAQEALLAFAQKGYETGLQGTTYRYDKGARNLALRDRPGTPEAQLSGEVMPDAPLILIHDHPNPNLDGEALHELLAEMTAVVQAVESSFR